MKGKMIGLRTAVIALVMVPGIAASASASAATVAAAAGSRAAHAAAAGKASYDIMSGTCDSAHKTWIHITFADGTTTCYGGNGSLVIGGTHKMTRLCSGNNFGDVFYVNATGGEGVFNFTPGVLITFNPAVKLTEVTITSSSGSDSC